MNALVRRLAQYRRLKLVASMWIATWLVNLPLGMALGFSFEYELLDENLMGNEVYSSMSLAGFILMALVVAPIIETWIFQLGLLLLIKVLTEKLAKSDSWIPAFLITSLAFAAYHAFNAEDAYSMCGLLNAALRVPAGIALTLLAIVERTREDGFPVLSVMLLHSMLNAVPVLLVLPFFFFDLLYGQA